MIGRDALLELAFAAAALGGAAWAGYHYGHAAGAASMRPELDRTVAERDAARTERDQQAGALRSLAAAAEDHAKRLAARARDAQNAARMRAIDIEELLRAEPASPSEAVACPAGDLARRYLRAARAARVPHDDAPSDRPPDPGTVPGPSSDPPSTSTAGRGAAGRRRWAGDRAGDGARS